MEDTSTVKYYTFNTEKLTLIVDSNSFDIHAKLGIYIVKKVDR